MIGETLVMASFMSLVGCFVATVISDRVGLSRPLLIALNFVALSAFLMVGDISENTFLLSVFGFNFLWIFVDVYQMGTMSNFDPSGKYVALIPGAQGVGQIVGPNLAATLLSYELGYDSVFIMRLLVNNWYVDLRFCLHALAQNHPSPGRCRITILDLFIH